MTAERELPKSYDPATHEARVTQRWLDAAAFAAVPDARPPEQRYVIMMPLPNVTGALHMGHAMDNVMQDLLIRWQRMRGANTLWQPGTDHAGIATQAVVEKRLKELEGKTRHDIGREALVERIWGWKDEYQARIVTQQQAMGCSCDWDRQRFTMDAVCSAAVREAFFRLFRDRLIYRGDRLVNWDCVLQTAVANDEVFHETVPGHFWHLRYPVIDPAPGEPSHVIVATTRPETMLGDTAVAVHPDPAAALDALIASAKDAGDDDKVAALEARRHTHLAALEQLRDMAQAGRTLRLPLQDREIPLICDRWAKPELGSGCVKITPAHDPNDYEVWTRHRDRIDIINILELDGTLNRDAGRFAGQDRFAARANVVAALDELGLLDRVEDREVEIGHSDRSKTPIEPLLCKQWWVRMTDVEGGVVCGRGTAKEQRHAGLAQAAIDAAGEDWRSPSGRRVDFHPDAKRYRQSYVAWLAEKRDWCISRQLWWGHQIPVWWRRFDDAEALAEVATQVAAKLSAAADVAHLWIGDDDGNQYDLDDGLAKARAHAGGRYELQVCLRSEAADAAHGSALEALGLERDADVLDTWFSSALWPFSTLGWPDPQDAPILAGQRPLAPEGQPSSLDYYYPGSCLVTGRDILTLWVARMVIMGLYCMGDVPFTDVFLHCKILDGNGQTMSKSRGNGVDPMDISERYGTDGMRYVICDMQTGTQDARLPVQAHCPNPDCALNQSDPPGVVELSEAEHGRTIFTYLCPSCASEFDVLGTLASQGVPQTKALSTRFEAGKNFCNKLWNAARFALMNLDGASFTARALADMASEDRWILSRLSQTIDVVHAELELYNPSAALNTAREFFWGEMCDWYLELIKPRMREDADPASRAAAQQTLAAVLDQVLRLLHPFLPFVTEVLWENLGRVAQRGVDEELTVTPLCIHAPWPKSRPDWRDEALEASYANLQEIIRSIRNVRSKYKVSPRKPLPVAIRGGEAELAALAGLEEHIRTMATTGELVLGQQADKPDNAATALIAGLELFVGEVFDPQQERARLEQAIAKLDKVIVAGQKKLGNAKFVERAPADVVAVERERLTTAEAERRSLADALASL